MHLSCLRNPGERLADSQPAAQAQQHQRPSRWLRYRGRGQPKVHTGDLIADESAEFAVAGLEVAQKRRGLAIGVRRTRIIEKLILPEDGVLARGGRPALLQGAGPRDAGFGLQELSLGFELRGLNLRVVIDQVMETDRGVEFRGQHLFPERLAELVFLVERRGRRSGPSPRAWGCPAAGGVTVQTGARKLDFAPVRVVEPGDSNS